MSDRGLDRGRIGIEYIMVWHIEKVATTGQNR